MLPSLECVVGKDRVVEIPYVTGAEQPLAVVPPRRNSLPIGVRALLGLTVDYLQGTTR